MQKLEEILSKILDIIKYQRDKNEFITKFTTAAKQEALIALIDQLPPDRKDGLKTKVESEEDPEKLKAIIDEFFPNGEFKETFKKTTENVLTDYVKVITPTLPSDKQEALKSYLGSVNLGAISL